MENKFKINGLWIPYQILTDKNLKDKEKIIYSLILFFSNNKGYCSIRNKYLEDLLARSTKRISSIINTLQDKKYIHIVPRNNREERKLYPLVDVNDVSEKVLFKGLFIPINVLSDNNLNEKEKFIYSIALYYSNVHKQCTLNNENFHKIFGVTKNQISRIVNSLNKKDILLMIISIKIIIKRFYIEKLDLYAKMMIPIVKKFKMSIIKKFNKIYSKMLMY